jgi:EAL domain-containing protein (putative c-di-GMP-specific phosphodiesterase class I)
LLKWKEESRTCKHTSEPGRLPAASFEWKSSLHMGPALKRRETGDVRMKLGYKRAKAQTRWFLEHVSNAPAKWMVPIEPVPFIIGRDGDCSLTLQSKWVSRHHAAIHRSGDLLWIRDLGSTNGTFVNRKKIQDAELVEPGDIISFGKFEFRIRSVDSTRPGQSDDTFSMDLTEELAYLATLEPRLRRLLSERTVIPHFQPIMSFSDSRVIGYEILGRVNEEGLPSNPSELFDAATYLGFASDLSALFREVGLDVGKKLEGSPLLFVNTNAVEMYETETLVESLRRVRDAGPSIRIVLEISEKAIPDTEEMVRFRTKLTDLDIGVAFDDFGVGQTRLVELAKTPPDFLKFDISLIHRIHLAPQRLHQMILTFVKAAQDLGIATIAEGIECLEESETCRLLGFEYAQGYYCGRPSPISELTISSR